MVLARKMGRVHAYQQARNNSLGIGQNEPLLQRPQRAQQISAATGGLAGPRQMLARSNSRSVQLSLGRKPDENLLVNCRTHTKSHWYGPERSWLIFVDNNIPPWSLPSFSSPASSEWVMNKSLLVTQVLANKNLVALA